MLCRWCRRRSSARNLNRSSAAVIENCDPARRVKIEGDDDADETDPFDGVVEVEEEILTWNKMLVILRYVLTENGYIESVQPME